MQVAFLNNKNNDPERMKKAPFIIARLAEPKALNTVNISKKNQKSGKTCSHGERITIV